MTTTVVAMEETIKLLHAEVPGVKIIVGGAVLTPEYAKQIGADYYAKDAAESARIAEEVFRRAVTQRKQPSTKTCRTRHLARAAR